MQLSLHSYTFFNSLMENFHTFINGKLQRGPSYSLILMNFIVNFTHSFNIDFLYSLQTLTVCFTLNGCHFIYSSRVIFFHTIHLVSREGHMGLFFTHHRIAFTWHTGTRAISEHNIRKCTFVYFFFVITCQMHAIFFRQSSDAIKLVCQPLHCITALHTENI